MVEVDHRHLANTRVLMARRCHQEALPWRLVGSSWHCPLGGGHFLCVKDLGQVLSSWPPLGVLGSDLCGRAGKGEARRKNAGYEAGWRRSRAGPGRDRGGCAAGESSGWRGPTWPGSGLPGTPCPWRLHCLPLPGTRSVPAQRARPCWEDASVSSRERCLQRLRVAPTTCPVYQRTGV